MTSLAEYVSRMKDKQEMIFYVAGNSREEVTVLHSSYKKVVLFFKLDFGDTGKE